MLLLYLRMLWLVSLIDTLVWITESSSRPPARSGIYSHDGHVDKEKEFVGPTRSSFSGAKAGIR